MVVYASYPLGETRVERQAHALLVRGIQVDLICLRRGNEPAFENVDGVHVYRMPVHRTKYKGGGVVLQFFEYLAFSFMASVRLTCLCLKHRYNVVQVHNLPDFLVFSAFFPKLIGVAVILDLHDLMPEFYAERFHKSMDSGMVRLVRWQEKASCRFANHVITVTGLWRQSLIQRGHLSEKISVIMNVADDRVFNRRTIQKVERRRNGFHLIYHGTMARRHGLDVALRALDIVRRTAPDVYLTLHGGGEILKALRTLTEELKLQGHVQFSTRLVTAAELAVLIASADLAVVPYQDGIFTGGILPTKLIEYAMMGIPAVVARTPAIASYFRPDEVHFFSPGNVQELADSILALYRDRVRLATLAEAISRFNERHHWAGQGRTYTELVERLGTREG